MIVLKNTGGMLCAKTSSMLPICNMLYKNGPGLDVECHNDAAEAKSPLNIWCDGMTEYQDGVRLNERAGLIEVTVPQMPRISLDHIPGP